MKNKVSKRNSATYGKPSLHKKQKLLLALAKAKRTLVERTSQQRPLSVREKLSQIFGPDAGGELSNPSAANTKNVTVSIGDPLNQEQEIIHSEESVLNFSPENNLNLEADFSVFDPGNDHSLLCMETPLETSTPVKKSGISVAIEKSSPNLSKSCFNSSSSLDIISSQDNQLIENEDSPSKSGLQSAAKAAKAAKDAKDGKDGNIEVTDVSHPITAEKNCHSEIDSVLEGLLKLIEAGFDIRLSKKDSSCQSPPTQTSSTLMRKRTRPRFPSAKYMKIYKKKEKKKRENHSIKKRVVSVSPKPSTPTKENLTMNDSKIARSHDNIPICAPNFEINHWEKHELTEILPESNNCFENDEIEPDFPDPLSESSHSMDITTTFGDHVPSPVLAADKQCSPELEPIDIEGSLFEQDGSCAMPETSEVMKFSEIIFPSQYQILLAQCALGPDPIDLLGRRRMRT